MKSKINELINKYLQFCSNQKNLSSKTIKSYSIDLKQYSHFNDVSNTDKWATKENIQIYIAHIHKRYKPKSIKRKIASLKAFFRYLEMEEFIKSNPFHKIQVKYKETFTLPKTIPLKSIEVLINFAYREYKTQATQYSKKIALRNIVIIELLFATGMRVSELCNLTIKQIDLSEYTIKILGKGSKERLIQICNKNIQCIINEYIKIFNYEIKHYDYFFTNKLHNRLSEQSVRNIIKKYVINSGLQTHITPHMFRHSFATQLLEEDVDIRYIQQMLGHNSITTTQIYTHISINKQRDILSTKHPRNNFEITI